MEWLKKQRAGPNRISYSRFLKSAGRKNNELHEAIKSHRIIMSTLPIKLAFFTYFILGNIQIRQRQQKRIHDSFGIEYF